MKDQYCYIEFDFTNETNFEDLKSVFEIIKDSKNNHVERDDQFWIETFPKYALEKFTFSDSDLKPKFDTSKDTDTNWHFYSLIDLLVINYEIEYIDLKKIDKKGVLVYNPYSYPYGGIEGLITFIESFNSYPKLYDDGTGIYNYHDEKVKKTKKSIWSFLNFKNLYKYFIYLLFITLLLSCNKKNDLQFEKDVMYEVYPALIDSVWVNAMLTYVPPPPPGIDPSEYTLNRRNESNKRFNKELAEFKKKKFPVDLVFLDKTVVRDNSKELQKHFKDAIPSEDNTLDTLNYKFNKKKLNSYQAFKLHYVPRIPCGSDRRFYNECCYSVRGVFILSRIQFDDEKKYGLLTAEINCGDMCTYRYRIFIKKVEEKWVIDKIEKAWIA